MKNLFARAISFIKENPSVMYSLVLVLLVPIAFFINTYLVNLSYEEDLNKITQRKAILIEDILENVIAKEANNADKIQEIIGNIISEDSEVVSLTVSNFQNQTNDFKIVAASDKNLVGNIQPDNMQNMIAWTNPEGIAFLDEKNNERFWKVTKILKSNSEEKIGLISMSLSLASTDFLINRTIRNSYWVLFVTIIIVLLFVSNQARLFGYALMVTKLKEIDKMKDMFISMASHELRSPLGAMKGYVDFLKDKKEILADEDANHYVSNISLSIERLNGLVADMLEVSRIEGNRMPMEISEINPNKVISESVEEIKSQAIQKGLKLIYTPPIDDKLIILADVNRLKQVLINLIGNSIKYTPAGSVTVSVVAKNNELGITIADTGIGISSEDQANLFNKFHRIQNEKTKNIIGTGLGLWITMEIVKRMNGRITIESIEGVGSHFTVYLPVVKK
ncbi:MAG: HAMP domain-containing sensor histidine kinase [Parcubacteria group bacterium]|jgi:signal transduction histidine kinase